DVIVRIDGDGIWITSRAYALDDRIRRRVEDRDSVTEVLRDEEPAAVMRQREAGGVDNAELLLLLLLLLILLFLLFLLVQHDALGERGAFLLPRVAVDRIVVAAGRPQRMTVRREDDADERRDLRQELRDLASGAIHHLHPLLPPTAEKQHDAISFGRK